jgi:hypothetical protein
MKTKILLLALTTSILTHPAKADDSAPPETFGEDIIVTADRLRTDYSLNNYSGSSSYMDSRAGIVNYGGGADSYESVDQCSIAEAEVNQAIDEIKQKQPPVRLIGEIHFGEEGALTIDETKDLISRVQSNTGGGCLAIEHPPSAANQILVVLQVEVANQLGMRPIFIDTAAEGMTIEQSLTTEGLNIRDTAMAQNIRSNLSSCGTIVSLLGALHATHKQDVNYGYDPTKRVNVKDHLGNLAEAVDVSEAGLACKAE